MPLLVLEGLELIAATREKTHSKVSAQYPTLGKLQPIFEHLLVRISEGIGRENLFHQAVQIYIAGFNNARIT
jgi:hypothetical protein